MARKTASRNQQRKRAAWPIWSSLLLGSLAQLTFKLDLSIAGGLLLYLLAAILFVQSVAVIESESVTDSDASSLSLVTGKFATTFAKHWLEWLIVIVLILIASFFRLYRIYSQPVSLWLDESLTGLNALEIVEGKTAPIWEMTPLDRWRPNWVKTSNLYLYYVVLVFKIFGTGYFGLKMVSVLPAIAGVVAAYFLFKEMSNSAIAFLSVFLIAVSQWHVTISRWGWDAVLMCFLQLVSYYYLIRGVKSGRKLQFVFSGALMGLCLYTYVVSWIAASIASTFLLLRAVRERNLLGTHLRDLLFFLAACLLVFAPLGVHYFQNPGDLTVRASEVTLAKAVAETDSYFPLWENFRNYALMFNYKGDKNPRHGFPNEPVMDLVTSIFFVLGLAHYAWFWKSSHNAFLLLWLALGLLPGLLSEPSTSPHAFRTFMTSAVGCFFAATAFYLSLCASWKAFSNFRYKNVTATIFSIILLGYIASANYWSYFVSRPKSHEVWEEESRDGGLSVKFKALQKESQMIIVDPLLLWKIVVVNSWFLTYQPGKLFESPFLPANLLTAETKLGQIGGERQLSYIYSPVFQSMLRSLFPDGKSEVVRSPFGDSLYGAVHVTAGDLRLRLASAEKSSLAAAIRTITLYYERQSAVDAEVGPRRKLLLDEFDIGIKLVKQLDPNIP